MADWRTRLLQCKRKESPGPFSSGSRELLVTSWTAFDGEPFADVYENNIDVERRRNFGTNDGAMSLSLDEAKSIRDALQKHIDKYDKK